MTNNTTAGVYQLKTNVTPNTTTAGGVLGATLQDHYEWRGTFTLNGATPVTVTEPNFTANSIIDITLKTVGGTVGAQPVPQTVTPGTGFTVAGTAGDTSVYNYRIVG